MAVKVLNVGPAVRRRKPSRRRRGNNRPARPERDFSHSPRCMPRVRHGPKPEPVRDRNRSGYPKIMSTPHGASRWLPPIGSRRYHLMLSLVAIGILGPLGGISAAFMNFSIGFFVGGQVLAGILGSVVTLPYGPEGKHGGNYMQTMAASVAGMCAMAVLVQAMVWLGLPEPSAWKLGSMLKMPLNTLCTNVMWLPIPVLPPSCAFR